MKARSFSFWNRLKEIDMFFEGRGREHKALRRIVQKLDKAGISYALVGGMAVNAHRHERTTKDVDLLLTAEGLAEFRRLYVPRDYEPVPRRPRRFIDRTNKVAIDFLSRACSLAAANRGPISYPNPAVVAEVIAEVRVVNLASLIELKLAARRYQDYADVVNLIRVHDLDAKFQRRIHETVHRDFIDCLEEKRREDEYEARP